MAAPVTRIAIIRNNDTDIKDVIKQLVGLVGTTNVVVVNVDTNPFPTTIQAVDFDFYVITGVKFPTLCDRNLMMQLHQHVVTNRKVIFIQGKLLAMGIAAALGIPDEQRNRVRYYENPLPKCFI